MNNNNREFTVTNDHMKLLPRLHFEFSNYMYDGAPAVDPKRPYGNSYVIDDLALLLGYYTNIDEDDDTAKEEILEKHYHNLLQTHEEMTTVLQILTVNNGVTPGTYTMTRPYDSLSWKRK